MNKSTPNCDSSSQSELLQGGGGAAAKSRAEATAALLLVQSLVLALLEKHALTSEEIFEALDTARMTVRSANDIESETARAAEQVILDFLDRIASAIPE